MGFIYCRKDGLTCMSALPKHPHVLTCPLWAVKSNSYKNTFCLTKMALSLQCVHISMDLAFKRGLVLLY